jgi:hypothetical protein
LSEFYVDRSDAADTSINSKVASSASKQTRFCPNFPHIVRSGAARKR